MPSASLRAHAAAPFMNPLPEAGVDAAIAALELPEGALVLETGCGAAELLLRVLEAHPGARGLGVDPDADALARAREAAMRRVPGREPELRAAPAEDAGLERGAADLVVNVASSHAHGGWPAAPAALAALARPGGLVLYGEGFWREAPSAAFLEALGGATEDELPLGLAALLDGIRAGGLEPIAVAEASVEDLRAYEEALAAEAERYDDEEARAYARRIRERRALPDGATALGFALVMARVGA